MDYVKFWNEFFTQLLTHLPGILNLIFTAWIAFNVKDIRKTNGTLKSSEGDIKRYGDYGGYKCPWSNQIIPPYVVKDWEKEVGTGTNPVNE